MARKSNRRYRRAAAGTIIGLLASLILSGMFIIESEPGSWSPFRSSARAMEMEAIPQMQATTGATMPVQTAFPTGVLPGGTTTAIVVTPTQPSPPLPTGTAAATETPLAPTATEAPTAEATPTPEATNTPTDTTTTNVGLSESTVDCKGKGCSGRCYFQNRIELTCDKDKKIVGFSLTYPKGTTVPDCCTPDRSNGRGKFLAKDDDGIWYSYTGDNANPGTEDKPKPLSDIFDVSRPTVFWSLSSCSAEVDSMRSNQR